MSEKIKTSIGFPENINTFLRKRNSTPEFYVDKKIVEEIARKSSDKIPDKLAIHLIQNFDELISIRKEWDKLVEQSPVTIFQTFDWQMLWWKHFGSNPSFELHTLLIRDKEKLVGIFPLFIESTYLFNNKIYNRLRFIASGVQSNFSDDMINRQGPSDFLDAIILPEYRSEAVSAFINYLFSQPSLFDEIELVCLPENSILIEKLRSEFDKENFKYTIRKLNVCPQLKTPQSLKNYLAHLNGNVRNRLIRGRKKLFENKNSSLEVISTLQEMRTCFRDLVQLHQVRWNRIGYPGIFSDQRFELFLEEVCEEFWRRGRIWFKAVNMNDNNYSELETKNLKKFSPGKSVASRLGFVFKEQIFDYLSGFDNFSSASKYRPGLILLLSMIEDAIETSCRSVELLRGKESYKFEFTDDYSTNYQINIKSKIKKFNLRLSLFVIVKFFKRLRHRFFYEALLLRIQSKQYRFPASIIQYFNFRVRSFSKKIMRRI